MDAVDAGFYALLAADAAQTVQISRNCPEKYSETNAILGDCPSQRRVAAYFAGAAIGYEALKRILPAEVADKFRFIAIGVEIGSVAHNVRIGVSF